MSGIFLKIVLICAFGHVGMGDNFKYTIELERANCSNTNFCHMESCAVKALSRYKTVFNYNCNLTESIRPGTTIKMTLLYRFNNIYKYLFDVEESACDELENSFKADRALIPSTSILGVLFPLIRKHSNVNHTCPIRDAVTIRNLEIRDNFLPSLLTIGQYRFDLTAKEKSKQFSFSIYFSFNSYANRNKNQTKTNH